ncbi:hypothetical protein Tco_1145755 [Tanacetum coccineum]
MLHNNKQKWVKGQEIPLNPNTHPQLLHYLILNESLFYHYLNPKRLKNLGKPKGPLRYLSLSGPIPLVANETVIKEWEDRMERVATTASSLEAEQDSGNINRTQSMATHNESFPQGTGSENPTIYVSLIQQFWNTATVRTLDNGEMEITATIDGKVKIVTEASIRRHLKLEDSDGPSCLGQEFVVPQTKSPTQTNVADKAASTGVDVRHGGASTTVTSLNAGQGSGNIDKTPYMPHDSLLPRVKKLKKTIKTRQARRKARIVVSDDEEDLEDPSKQGRKIPEIDQDLDISLVQHDAKVQGRHEHDIEPDFEFTTAKEVYTAEKEVSTAEQVSTTSALVSTARASLAKDNCKAIMEEVETIQTKTKLQLEQERLDNIQARVGASEKFAQRLQSEEREMYSEAEKARLLAELINERKRYFAAQRAEERRYKPLTQAQ